MGKKLTAIFLFVAVAGSTFNKLVVLLDFRINRNYIVAVLCVNKDQPGSCCKGKCYVKKKMEQDGAARNQGSGDAREKFELNWFWEENTSPAWSASNAHSYFTNTDAKLPFNFVSGIFHPPATTA